ncbi:uncharacterized protein Cda5 isoform X11 [Panulirus ornatus]|uniref:uncharacterized protein Cda5 isoform X11 n=1 Tax=Panulirus ornatus TaxID=150431 RepID=UPI003A8398B8
MGWTTKLLLLSLLGLSACQQRSLNGGRRRQRISAGKSEIASFNCPQDFGYYPHPSDCTQYYVCVFGGALQESCTGGLVYSHELETCDWPRNVECTPSAAGSGIAPVRSTDQRPPNSSPVRTATESLTPSVGSFDSRFEHSYTPKDSRSPQKFDGNDRSNSPRALFRQQPNPKQSLASPRFSQQSFFDTSVQESSQRPVNAKPTTFRPQVFSLQLQSRVGRVRSVRDTSASSAKLLQRDLTTLDATQDSDFGRSALEPSIPSAATARLGLASRTHEPPQSSGSTAVNPRNIPFHFLNSRPDQRSTRRQSSSQGNFFHQDAPRKQIHPQQFRRAPSSFNQHFRPPITFPRQSSPANPFGNFQSFTPFASTFDTRPFSNPAREQTRQPPIQQQLHPQRQRPRPEVASFPHRPHSDAFLQKPQPPKSFLPGSHLQSFSPVAHPESFQPVPHLDPFSTEPQLESFQPGVQTGSFQPGFQSESFPTSPHRESNPSRPLPESVHSSSLNTRFPSLPKSEPFLPEEAAVRPAHDQPRKHSRPTSTSHSVKPFKPIRQTPHPLQTPRRPSPFLLEETSFPSRPSQSQLDSSPSQEPIYIPSDTRVPQRPSPTRPSKRNPTSSDLRVTSPAPRVTSPAPRITSPAPRVTSPAPRVTSPAPSITSPAPRVTSPVPRVTSPAPRVTSPENYPVLNSIEITDQSPKRNRRPGNPLGQSVTTKPPRRQPSTFPPFSKARSTFPPFHSLSQKAPSLALPPQIPGTVHHPELSRLPVSTPKTSDLSLSSPNLLPNTQDSRQPLRYPATLLTNTSTKCYMFRAALTQKP